MNQKKQEILDKMFKRLLKEPNGLALYTVGWFWREISRASLKTLQSYIVAVASEDDELFTFGKFETEKSEAKESAKQ